MSTIDRPSLEAQLRLVLELLADPTKVPRHPRGFQGKVEPVDMILVAQFRDPQTGKLYVADPSELNPGEGETPQPDLFLRDYVPVGQRRGGGLNLGTILTKLLPIVGGGPAGAGMVSEILLDLFRKKR